MSKPHQFWGSGPDGLCPCDGCNGPDLEDLRDAVIAAARASQRVCLDCAEKRPCRPGDQWLHQTVRALDGGDQ